MRGSRSSSAEAIRLRAVLPGRLIAARKYLEMGPSETARAAGMTPGQLANYESGRNLPRCDALKRLADALYVTADELLS